MDTEGARQLAARIRAGVWLGMRVEIDADLDPGPDAQQNGFDGDSRLCAGDRGVVEAIDGHGNVVVRWDRGFTLEVDPSRTPLRRLAA